MSALPTLAERIADFERLHAHWTERRLAATTPEFEQTARHWQSNIARVLERLRAQQAKAA